MNTSQLFAYLSLCFLCFTSWRATAQSTDVVTVELYNNCGKKVNIEVELAFNKLNTIMENGSRSKFKVKVGSVVKVNQTALLKFSAQEQGKTIMLCHESKDE